MKILSGAGIYRAPATGEGPDYIEQFRVPALSIGTYSIPVGGRDTQSPHNEDEIYVVTTGQARFTSATGDAQVGPGEVIYVPAGEEHRFVDVTEDFAVLVFFAPSESSDEVR